MEKKKQKKGFCPTMTDKLESVRYGAAPPGQRGRKVYVYDTKERGRKEFRLVRRVREKAKLTRIFPITKRDISKLRHPII